MSITAPGWYSDPYDQRLMRWWNGQSWTAHAQVVPEPPALPAESVAPATPAVSVAQAAAAVSVAPIAPAVFVAPVAPIAPVAPVATAAPVPTAAPVATAAAPLPTRRSLRAYAALDAYKGDAHAGDAHAGDAHAGAELRFSTTHPVGADVAAGAPVTPVATDASSLPSAASGPARWENLLAGDVPRRNSGRHSQLLSVALVIGIVGLGGCGVYFYPLVAAGF